MNKRPFHFFAVLIRHKVQNCSESPLDSAQRCCEQHNCVEAEELQLLGAAEGVALNGLNSLGTQVLRTAEGKAQGLAFSSFLALAVNMLKGVVSNSL